jgi:curved DNA-binding protein CbpA
MTTLYKILGVDSTATDDEIKAAYRSNAQRAHPDKGGSVEQFQAIQKAYEVLRDPQRRANYDDNGSTEATLDIEQAARSMVATMFLQAVNILDTEHTDIVAHINDHLAKLTPQIEKAIISSEKQVEKRRAVMKRAIRKDGSDNILVAILEGNIRDLEREQAALSQQLSTVLAASRILEDYEYTADINVESPVQLWDSNRTSAFMQY